MEDLDLLYEPLPALGKILAAVKSSENQDKESNTDDSEPQEQCYKVYMGQWYSRMVRVMATSDRDAEQQVIDAFTNGDVGFDDDDAYDFPEIESEGIDTDGNPPDIWTRRSY